MRRPKQIALKLAESQKDDVETTAINFSSQSAESPTGGAGCAACS